MQVNAEEIMAPELHTDPFVNPLLENLKESGLEQDLNSNLSSSENGPRTSYLWKPELRGIIRSADISIVNIDGNMISKGEEFEGYRLIKVKERTVVFEKNGRHYPLSLDKEDEKQKTL